jgi:hypothetical protein
MYGSKMGIGEKVPMERNFELRNVMESTINDVTDVQNRRFGDLGRVFHKSVRFRRRGQALSARLGGQRVSI